MDIYTLIHQDHEAARKLIEQINGLPETRYPDRFSLFGQLKEAVIEHNDAEAASFYVEFERNRDVRSKIAHSREEHAQVAYLLEKLSDTEMVPAAWNKIFTEFQRALFHHIEEEEGKVFLEARKVISRQRATQLACAMEELKLKKKELLHKAG